MLCLTLLVVAALPIAQTVISAPPQFNGDQSGIGSWFQTNAASSFTNGHSWCGCPYSDDQPLFAPVGCSSNHYKCKLTHTRVPVPDGRRHFRSILGPTAPTILWPRSQRHQSCQWQKQTSLHRRLIRSTSLRRCHRHRPRCFH